jgi:hypothetical protein
MLPSYARRTGDKRRKSKKVPRSISAKREGEPTAYIASESISADVSPEISKNTHLKINLFTSLYRRSPTFTEIL